MTGAAVGAGGATSAHIRSGIWFTVLSASSFGLSGPLAKSLMSAGWSPGAAVFARIAGAAVVMSIFAAALEGRRLRTAFRHPVVLLLYGLLAVAGVQAAFFLALQHLSVGVSLMIQFLAPILVIVIEWIFGGRTPSAMTVLGAILALAGAVLVLDVFGSLAISVVGVAWALLSTVCLVAFFMIGSRTSDTLSPLALGAGGMSLGTIGIGLLGIFGLFPFTFSTAAAPIAGRELTWFVALGLLIMISTVVPYLSGIAGLARIGPTLTSLVLLSEVLFAVVFSWLLLGEAVSPIQLLGGAAIIGGVALARIGGAGPRAVSGDQPPQQPSDPAIAERTSRVATFRAAKSASAG